MGFGCSRPLVAAFLFFGIGAAAHADETLHYTWQGVDRTAILHVPPGVPGRAAPLVIVLYGSDDRAASFQKNSGFDAVADRENFVTLYPEAIDGWWALSARKPQVNGQPVDDVGLIRTMIDDLVRRGVVDGAHVYAGGFSLGALMSYTLACAMPDRIAAIAAASSGINEAQVEACKPGHAMPLMMVSGTSDSVQLYDGYIRSFGRLLSVPETLEYWRRADGCTGEAAGKPLPHLNDHDLTRTSVVQWSGCMADTGVELYRIENGGHCWPRLLAPGHEQAADGPRFGGCSNDIETPAEMWNFFRRFSRG